MRNDDVVLMLDACAIEDAGFGKRRIKTDRLMGPPRTRERRVTLGRSKGRDRECEALRCTGVLVRNASGRLLVATAAHCFWPQAELFKGVRFIVGLRSLDQPFDRRQELMPKEILHFENSPDRDLAIWAAGPAHDGAMPPNDRGARLPPDSLRVEVGDELIVVGHPEGRNHHEYSGRVESVIAPLGSNVHRGFNVAFEKRGRGMSGSPAYLPDGTLVGVLQGGRPVTAARRLLMEIVGKPSEVVQARQLQAERLESIGAALGRRGLLLDQGELTALAEGLQAAYEEYRVPGSGGAMSLESAGPTLDGGQGMSALDDESSALLLASDEFPRIIEELDACCDPHADVFANIVFLGGAVSTFLFK